ncbi:tRNA pseudouridine(38-40) synthase TruA [Salinarimonas sp.]|uniref:tRNA pseudouridine(38-40) synthase TruA n=1 Tax=Salinarimonas sp. TaxID=2766526 RepID=UPI00391DFBBF
MPRYKLVVEYDGTPYSGWQRQANGRSVQQVLEEAIEAFCGHPVRLHCAGRTDAGVHATHQVAHVDLDRPFRLDTIRDAANAHMRDDLIAVVRAQAVSETFNARLSAVRRHYRYRILNRGAPATLDRTRVWHVRQRIDVALMQEAADQLLGHHDFTTFRASQCQGRTPMKTLERLAVSAHGEEVHVEAASRSFLHNQVRSMVGTILLAGIGRWSVAEVRAALEARDRTRCGALAPPHGLYFVGVDYAPGAEDPREG